MAFLTCLLPFTFFMVLVVWREVDRSHGRREVAEFILSHSELVRHRLTDARVHSFSLTPDPEDTSTLVIQFDVQDRDAYLMLEDDLGDWVELTFFPKWHTSLRSNEDLGNNFGFMAAGIGEAYLGMMRAAVAAAISVAICFCADAIRRIFKVMTKQLEPSDQDRESAVLSTAP